MCDNDTDSICIEGIEDVDIKTESEKIAIQCKYYEGTEYNHSAIAQPLRYMLDHYLSCGGNKINYMIYGYYKSGQDKLKTPFDRNSFKTYFLPLKAFKNINLSDDQMDDFISRLKININADEFEILEEKIITQLKSTFNCNDFEAEYFYYNNSLRVVKELSTNKIIEMRNITKADFILKINKKEVLFNQWYLVKKGLDNYCKMIKREYFSQFNLSPFERFFLIECDSIIPDVEIKSLMIEIGKKYAKISKREPNSFCPYIYLHNLSEERRNEILKCLHDENIKFIDGYDYKGAEFSVTSITQKATSANKINFKIIYDTKSLDMILGNNTATTQEIYQFYIKEPFYINTKHNHVKVLVEQTNHINKII